jgi:nucleotide-binding universal stress UspA family protein
MKILVATGGSFHSEVALNFSSHVIQLGQPASNSLTVLTVLKGIEDHPRAEEILTHATELLASLVPKLDTRVRTGHPAEEIIREVEEGGYDLVIVGQRQHHGLVTRFILGSTAERVVEHAPCPVIIARGRIRSIRRILLCDSGFRNPSLLSRFAEQLPELIRSDEAITVLHVMSQISAGPGVPGAQLRAGAEQLIASHAPEGELLAQDLRILAELNMSARPKIRHGRVVDEILAESYAEDYDLVVIGAHRGEGWRRILLDDLARQLITQIDRPILVVR